MDVLRPAQTGRIVARSKVSKVSKFTVYVDLPGDWGSDKDDVYLFLESVGGVWHNYYDSQQASTNYRLNATLYLDIAQAKSFNSGGTGYQKQGNSMRIANLQMTDSGATGYTQVQGNKPSLPLSMRNEEMLPLRVKPGDLKAAYWTFTLETVDNYPLNSIGFQNTDLCTVVFGVAKFVE
jgi:hypothetical protein